MFCVSLFAASNVEAARRHHKTKHRQKRQGTKQQQFSLLVRQELKQSLPQDLQLLSLKCPKRLHRYLGRTKQITLHWRRAPHAGNAIVQIRVYGRRGVHKGWARLELQRVGDVLVAQKKLKAGSRIQEGDLQLVRRGFREGLALRDLPPSLLGAKIMHDRKANETLEAHDVLRKPPLPRGHPVQVIVQRGAIRIATPGVLETSVRVGERARARIGGKLLHGTLLSTTRFQVGK